MPRDRIISTNFGNEREIKDFVAECEELFDFGLEAASQNLLNRKKQIITLGGPSCSGKTTSAQRLVKDLSQAGANVHLISFDDFFKDRAELDRIAKLSGKPPDYDSVNAINLGMLEKCISQILAHKKTELPVFDFQTGTHTGSNTVESNDNSIFIFEGIQAYYPEVDALLPEHTSVFINVRYNLVIDGVRFSNRELRLLRRIVRDNYFRNAEPSFTLELWKTVTANEDTGILPFADGCDIKINSMLPYEPMALRDTAFMLLDTVEDCDENAPVAEDLKGRIGQLDGIGNSFVPEDSLLREFIGKKGF